MKLGISACLSRKFACMSIFCAFLVVVIHTYVSSSQGSVYWWFSEVVGGGVFGSGGFVRIAVPYFFLASGYFVASKFGEPRWWHRGVITRTRTILVPYILWCSIFGMAGLIGAFLFDGWRPFLAEIVRVYGVCAQDRPVIIQYWFLRTLFLLVVASPILRKLANPVGLALLFVVFLLSRTNVGVSLSLGEMQKVMMCGWEGAFYLTVGIWLRVSGKSIENIPIRVALGLLLLSIALFSMAATFLYFTLPTCAIVVRTCTVPIAICSVWGLMPAVPVPKWIAGSAFPVYTLHIVFIEWLRSMMPGDVSSWLTVIYLSFGSFALSVLVMHLLRRVSGGFYRLAFGGR